MAYRRLPEVIAQHSGSVKVLHTLRPFGVAMAGEGEFDPFKRLSKAYAPCSPLPLSSVGRALGSDPGMSAVRIRERLPILTRGETGTRRSAKPS